MAGRVKNAKMLFLTGFILLLVLSTGCMNKSTKLAEGFDAEELKKASEQVVDQVNKNDYDSFINDAGDEVAESISQEKFENEVVHMRTAREPFNLTESRPLSGRSMRKQEKTAV